MNCIRCGRRIAEGKTFCDECAGVVREPLPDSPYTSLHIALPKRTDQPRPARKPVEQPEKKKPRSRRYHRMVRAIVSLALVCACSPAESSMSSSRGEGRSRYWPGAARSAFTTT